MAHQLGHHAPPAAYRELTVSLPAALVTRLEDHIACRIGEHVDEAQRDAVMALALEDHLDAWPEKAPPRAVCPACSASVQIQPGGLIGEHHDHRHPLHGTPRANEAPRCPASRLDIAEMRGV